MTCKCSEMDWTGEDMTREHHPQCTFGLAVVKQMSIEEAAKTYPWQGDYGTGTAYVSGQPHNPESGSVQMHVGDGKTVKVDLPFTVKPNPQCTAHLASPAYTWVPREEAERPGSGFPTLPEGATGWKVYPAAAAKHIVRGQESGKQDYTQREITEMLEKQYRGEVADENGYVNNVLHPFVQQKVAEALSAEREAIAEMLEQWSKQYISTSEHSAGIILIEAAKMVRERK